MIQVKSLKTGIKFKDTPIGKIPVDWEVTKLGRVGVLKGGNGFPEKYQGHRNKEYFFLKVSDMNLPGNEIYIKDSTNTIDRTIQDAIRCNLFPKSTIIFAKVGAALLLNRRRILAKESCIDNNMMGLIVNKEQNIKFYFYVMQSIDFAKYVSSGALPSINQSVLGDIDVVCPPLPEQKKIAEILTTVDDGIEETDRIIEKTKELKKGLMQKLLTRGIGHKKFKKTEIGEIPEEWEVVRLIDISKINPEQIKNSYPKNYQIKYLDIAGITQTGYINEIKDFTLEEAPSRARRIAQKNDILVSTVRPYLRAFARLKTCPDNLIVSTGYVVIRPKNPENSEYIYQNILNDQFVKYLLPHMTGSNYPAVRPNDIGNYLIALPIANERKKIADFLSSLDSEIEKSIADKQKLEVLKRALMRVLLTGKVRVKLSQ
jgi:type I restriction enzyme S subunit